MTQYRVIFDDPDHLDEPTKVLVPSDRWMKEAMEGNLPPISVYWELQDDEQQAIAEDKHKRLIKATVDAFEQQLASGNIRPN